MSNDQLETQYQAAIMVSEAMRVLEKSETNIVGEILKHTEEFIEWEHVPQEDVYDKQSHCQYYYHTHTKSEDGTNLHDDEHGHFHLFMRGKGIPKDITPAKLDDYEEKNIDDVDTHIIGIGMDAAGVPIRLFTTNRWVTGETWYQGEDFIRLIDQYEIDDTRPSWPANIWVTNMVALFKPDIIRLIKERDEKIAAWYNENKNNNVYEDRNLEVTSYMDINLLSYIDALEQKISQLNP